MIKYVDRLRMEVFAPRR